MAFTTPDHIVYAVPDLDAAVAWFGERAGVVLSKVGRILAAGHGWRWWLSESERIWS